MKRIGIPTLMLAAALTLWTPVWADQSDVFVGEDAWDDSVLTETTTIDPAPEETQPATLASVESAIKATPEDLTLYPKAAALLAADGYNGFKIYVEGTAIDFSRYDGITPVVRNGRTLVPVRAVAEALDSQVSWDPETREISIETDGETVILTLDSAAARINGASAALDAPAVSVNGRTMVPLRFIGEAFGLQVGWYPNGTAQVISMTQ